MKSIVAVLLLLSGAARAADPDILWKIVHDKCVPAADGKPCAEVSRDGGFAVLKDLNGIAQHLLIPTAKVTGIEDAAVLAPQTPNYFADAWNARHYVEARLGHPLPREAVSLAINSETGRSQNQLHIHIDCVRADVRAVLQGLTADHWASVPMPGGHSYRVRRIAADDLASTNPFRLLASEQPDSVADFGHHTIVLVGAEFAGQNGFYMLDDHADMMTLDPGSGEELQDHSCGLPK